MIRGSLIIIPNVSDEAQVCDFLLQTAKLLARENLVFVPTISTQFPGNSFIDENGVCHLKFWGILPFKRFAVISYLNRLFYLCCLQVYLTIRFPRQKQHYLWMFFPELAYLIKANLPWWKIIYDVVDFHFSPDQKQVIVLEQQKRLLLQNAHHVFCISRSISKLLQPYATKKIELVPQGFAFNDFAVSGQKTQLHFPKDKPIIGFVGQMSERLDFALLHELISNNLQWNFVFVGPKHHEPNVACKLNEQEIERLFEYKNCIHFDSQPKNTILSVINNFDVCIIPYNISFAFNLFSYPMKIFEYFYAGKPIVSTPIEELKKFNGLIKLANSATGFTTAITQFLEESWSKSKQAQQRKLAIQNSWEEKISVISKLL